MNLKLSDLRDIAFYTSAIPAYKAMGFKVDSKITSMSALALAEIEYEIGGKLKDVKQEINEVIEPIKQPIIEKFNNDIEDKSKEEAEAIERVTNIELQKALLSNEKLTELRKKEDNLWSKEIASTIKPIEIEEKEYDKLFNSEPKEVSLFDFKLKLDGYSCLLQLITKKVIIIKENVFLSE